MSQYTTVQRVLDRVGLSNINTDEVTTVSNEEVTFVNGVDTYTLAEIPVAAVTSIVGTLAGAPDHPFILNTDYNLSGNDIVWLGADQPDNATIFYTSYTYTNVLNSVLDYIEDASAYIEECVGKVYTLPYPQLVISVTTDLSCAYLLLRQSGGGSTTTAGMAYSIGKLQVDNKSGSVSTSAQSEINLYFKRAEKGIELLKNPPGEEGAPGSAPHTLRMAKTTYNDVPDPYAGI